MSGRIVEQRLAAIKDPVNALRDHENRILPHAVYVEVANYRTGHSRIQPTRRVRAKFSNRSAAVVTLSAGLVIRVAISRARATYSGARMRAEVRDQRFPGGAREAPGGTDFEPFDRSCPESADRTRPKDQRGDSGSQACGRGARATVVDDRAAGGKDGRVVHRAHHLHVVEMWDVGEVGRAGANQGSLA